MSGYSGWFDPICYQFYFYNVNSIGFAPEMNMAYRSFLEEIKPCCEHWISSSEDLLLKIHDSKDGYLVRKISDLEDVNYSLNSISNIEDQSVDEIKLSLCSSKAVGLLDNDIPLLLQMEMRFCKNQLLLDWFLM